MERDLTNLLEETIKKLADNHKLPADVKWVGAESFGWFPWDEFVAVADVEYNEGFGSANVSEDLLVVGEDFWLERHEYDGSEWWEFKAIPLRPMLSRKPETVIRKSYESNLREIHDGEGYE